jgi:hypothetical protein
MNTAPDEQFRRELNMNAGNPTRYFLVIYGLFALDATAPAMPIGRAGGMAGAMCRITRRIGRSALPV